MMELIADSPALEYHVTGKVDLEVSPKHVLIEYDPRFSATFARCQAEVNRVQVHFHTQYLRANCFVTEPEGVGHSEEGMPFAHRGFVRRATDAEIAEEGAFINEKNAASLFALRAGRACANRLLRQYGLRSRYA